MAPGGDGTGPAGPRGGQGRGFGGNQWGAPSNCTCPSCGYKGEKKRGVPCSQMKCPKCGALMIRCD